MVHFCAFRSHLWGDCDAFNKCLLQHKFSNIAFQLLFPGRAMANQDVDVQDFFQPFLAALRTSPGTEDESFWSNLADCRVAIEQAEPERIAVQDASGLRPRRLRLVIVASDRGLDTMYQQEWAELALGQDGHLYFLMRYLAQDDFASQWMAAVTLPSSLLNQVPDWLVDYL